MSTRRSTSVAWRPSRLAGARTSGRLGDVEARASGRLGAVDARTSGRLGGGDARTFPWLVAGAVASGLAVGAGFAPLAWWPLSILGIAGIVLVVRRTRGPGRVVAVGYGFGLGLTALTLNWMGAIHVAAAVGLILFMSCWYAALAVLLKLAQRTRWWPVLGAAAWVAVDFSSSRFPFGGFGWLRLGYTSVDSPLAGLLPLVGVAGLGFATAAAGMVLAWLLVEASGRRLVVAGAVAAVVGATTAVGAALQPAAADGEAVVGWVQGGAPGGGVYGLGPPRTITANQTRATLRLADEIAAGRWARPDFVVWPENSTDLDPATDPATGALVGEAVAALGRPLLVGAILDGPGPGERRTVTQWVEAGGQMGPSYDKRSIVPFGEWIPFRDVLLPLVPMLEYVGRQSVPGSEPGLLEVRLADGRPVTLGVLACFDVAFDPVVHDVAPAELLVVQSSNAMYQGTSQIEQQFVITRARAAELRREVLVVTTSGVTGLVDPFGRAVMRETGPGSAYGVVQLPLRTGSSPAARVAGPLEQLVSAVAAVWLLGLARKSDLPLVNGTRRPWKKDLSNFPEKLAEPLREE